MLTKKQKLAIFYILILTTIVSKNSFSMNKRKLSEDGQLEEKPCKREKLPEQFCCLCQENIEKDEEFILPECKHPLHLKEALTLYLRRTHPSLREFSGQTPDDSIISIENINTKYYNICPIFRTKFDNQTINILNTALKEKFKTEEDFFEFYNNYIVQQLRNELTHEIFRNATFIELLQQLPEFNAFVAELINNLYNFLPENIVINHVITLKRNDVAQIIYQNFFNNFKANYNLWVDEMNEQRTLHHEKEYDGLIELVKLWRNLEKYQN